MSNRFSMKYLPKCRKIVVVEDKTVVCDDSLISETMNNFFCNAVKCLGIVDNYPIESFTNDLPSNIIKTYESHPIIVNIKTNCSVASHFNFIQALDNDIGKIIETIDSSKGSLSAVPPKLLKNNKDICQS